MRLMVYTSVATDAMDQADVFTIVQKSAHNNMSRDITGFLIYGEGRFLQLIEGEEANLRHLLAILKTDPRHKGINVVVDEPIAQRRFGRWRMQRVTRDETAMGEIRQTLADGPSGRAALQQVNRFLAA